MELVFTKFINLVSLEQCHHKPIEMYGTGLLKLAIYGNIAEKGCAGGLKSDNVVISKNINIFKGRLDKVWGNKMYLYDE